MFFLRSRLARADHRLRRHLAGEREFARSRCSTGWLPDSIRRSRCIFIQSHVPAHAELHLLLSMITPLGWLERVPTYKEQRENIKDKDLGTYGFLGYPVLQSADILIYKADVVPVGEDQVAHVELTREIARRFNGFYGASQESVSRAAGAAHSRTPSCPAPTAARCRSRTGTRSC